MLPNIALTYEQNGAPPACRWLSNIDTIKSLNGLLKDRTYLAVQLLNKRQKPTRALDIKLLSNMMEVFGFEESINSSHLA